MERRLEIKDFVVEHQKNPLGIDCAEPRFGWKLVSEQKNVVQTFYQLKVYTEHGLEADTGKTESRTKSRQGPAHSRDRYKRRR